MSHLYFDWISGHDREDFCPLLPKGIRQKFRAIALGHPIIINKKRNGTIKGHGCADGRTQPVYKTKEKPSSPIACIRLIFVTGSMDTCEEREVSVVSIPGAFL